MNRNPSLFEVALYPLGLILHFMLWAIAVVVLTVFALIQIWRGKSVDTHPFLR